MKIIKEKIADLEMVYATAELNLNGKRYLTAVSEAPDGKAYLIDPETLGFTELWRGETGVMNVVQIPDTNRLLAITRFYPIFQSKEAHICLLEATNSDFKIPWNIREVLPMPFCHRIGIVKNHNGMFLLACQLCADKDYQEDWSQPGAIWAVPIPKDTKGEWKATKLYDGLTKNHGLFILKDNQAYVCCEDGVFFLDLSNYNVGESLDPVRLSKTPTSDIWVDESDRIKVAGCIEPFHGNIAAFYEMHDDSMLLLKKYPISFGHVMWIGKIFRKASSIIGNRGGEKKLELFYWQTGESITLDTGVGSTQINVFEENEEVKILSANHGSGEVAIYRLIDES